MRIRYILIFIIILTVSFNILNIVAAEKDTPDYLEYIVMKGDTIWYIAKNNNYLKKDIREVIWKIQKLNNIEDNLIYPGQVIKIPLK